MKTTSVGSCEPYSSRIGSCIRNPRLVGQTTFFSTWLVIPIASPSPTIGLSPSPNRRSGSVGRIMPITARSAPMTLDGVEFLRRFLQHILPKGFPRIRYFGWLANRKRGSLLQLCRLVLAQTSEPAPTASTPDQSVVQQCPKCHGPMRIVERFTSEETPNLARTS